MAADKLPILDKNARSPGPRLWFPIVFFLLCYCVHQTQFPGEQAAQRVLEKSDFVDELEDIAYSRDKTSTLLRRDGFNCNSKKPCKNGACCGKSGYCGYGPTYCSAGCLSNCGAVAECGKNAKQPGQKCPLNTCCSEFGFVSPLKKTEDLG